MIKNIIFDFGNVLVDYNLKEFMLKKGMTPDMIKRIVKATVMSPYWDEFDRGALTEEEAIAGFLTLDPGIEKELHAVFDNIHGMMVKRDFADEWIAALHSEGYKVFYLSNFSKKAATECADAIDFIGSMDGGIMSHQVLKVKPDPEIYRLLMDKCGLQSSECVFVDDTEENVEVAKSLGMEGITFISREDTDEKIKSEKRD